MCDAAGKKPNGLHLLSLEQLPLKIFFFFHSLFSLIDVYNKSDRKLLSIIFKQIGCNFYRCFSAVFATVDPFKMIHPFFTQALPYFNIFPFANIGINVEESHTDHFFYGVTEIQGSLSVYIKNIAVRCDSINPDRGLLKAKTGCTQINFQSVLFGYIDMRSDDTGYVSPGVFFGNFSFRMYPAPVSLFCAHSKFNG